MFRLFVPTLGAAMHMLSSMRERDQKEILNTFPHQDLGMWLSAVMNAPGVVFMGTLDERPVFLGGFITPWPGVAQSWITTTDLVHRCPHRVVEASRVKHTEMEATGVHRFQTVNRDGLDLYPRGYVCRYLRALGYDEEARMPGYGRDGSTYVSFSRLAGKGA